MEALCGFQGAFSFPGRLPGCPRQDRAATGQLEGLAGRSCDIATLPAAGVASQNLRKALSVRLKGRRSPSSQPMVVKNEINRPSRRWYATHCCVTSFPHRFARQAASSSWLQPLSSSKSASAWSHLPTTAAHEMGPGNEPSPEHENHPPGIIPRPSPRAAWQAPSS